MPVSTESSTIAPQLNLPRTRPRTHSISPTDPNPLHINSSNNNNNHKIPSIIQSTNCKSTISSLVLSTFSNTHKPTTKNKCSSAFKNSTFRGLGCTARPEVAVPAAIRASAEWGDEDRRERKVKGKSKKKKKQKKKKKIKKKNEEDLGQDVWCGPGFGVDSVVASASVDCVVSTARAVNGGRGKIDIDKVHHRERSSYASRQRVNPDHFTSFDLDSPCEFPRFGSNVFEARYYPHLRNRSPEAMAEIMMFQNGILMGRGSEGLDRYRDWRLDVDNMTYEELLELGDRIGYVSTGLREEQIGGCLRKTKLALLNDLSSLLPVEFDRKCSICQEEYEEEDEMGKLECGHSYHIQCIKQWLTQKNACPVCKAAASAKQ